MREVGSAELVKSVDSLLDLVESGEEVVITRRGKPVARLVPQVPDADDERARLIVGEIISMSKGKTLGGLGIKDLIEEGRP